MTFWQTVYSWRPWKTTALLHRILIELRVLGDKLVMEYTEVLALVTDIDAATNAVAAKLDTQFAMIADLQAQVAAGTPVSQAQLDALGAALTAEKDRLVALGADPANPIP